MDYLETLRSKLKLKIILILLKGEKRLADLKAELGGTTSETTILHVLKEFEKLQLTTKSGGVYRLSSLGLIEAQISKEYMSAAEAIGAFKDFWFLHDISGVPSDLLLQIGSLKESKVVKAESERMDKVHETFLEVILTSKKIQGISPIFHPDYLSAIQKSLNQKCSVELIITKNVLTRVLRSANSAQLRESLIEEKLKIYIKEDLKVALTITDKNFSLGLFNQKGEYDYSMDLISLSKEAIAWGEKLFQIYLKEAKLLEPDELC